MNQALHIWRKDVRHLWLNILIVLLLIGAHAYLEVRNSQFQALTQAGIQTSYGLVTFVLPLTIWFLIALVVYQETVPGDRQFWLTRPYHWSSLLTSKVLFIIAFINLPFLLSDCYILGAQDFSVMGVVPLLLLRQLHLTIVFVLPSFVIALLTTGPLQFLMAWFAVLLGIIAAIVTGSSLAGPGASVDIGSLGSRYVWVYGGAFIICAIIVCQYARRQTNAARVVAYIVSLVLAPALIGVSIDSANPTSAFQASSLGQTNVRIAYEGEITPDLRSSHPRGFISALIPFKVDGLPANTLLRGSAQTRIDVGGKPWHTPTEMFGRVERHGGRYTQTLEFRKTDLESLKQRPLDLHTAFDLEIVTDQADGIVAQDSSSRFTSGLTHCRALTSYDQLQVACKAGLLPSVELDIQNGTVDPMQIANEHSNPWGLSPTTNFGVVGFGPISKTTPIVLIPRRRLVKFQRTVDASGVQLSNYILLNH